MITVGDLKKIIKHLPNSMPVVLGIGESLEDICAANTKVIMVEFTDEDDEDKGGKENLLVLPICTCDEDEIELGEINSQPELN